MNSYARRHLGVDPAIKEWVGLRRAKDRRLVMASVVFVIVIYNAVYWSEEKVKVRRHESIMKDIERERWRAKELGLRVPTDDGFAERYSEAEEAKRKARADAWV